MTWPATGSPCGGAPAVWNTCLVFYQFALLTGYLYAHLAGKQPLKRQVIMQAVLLLAAAVMLPIAVHGSTPPASANPIWWVLGLLVMSLGLPFVVLASTGPLLQRWYASLGAQASRTVYSLFAASNVGSFLGLFFYLRVIMRMFMGSTDGVRAAAPAAAIAALAGTASARATRRAAGVGVAADAIAAFEGQLAEPLGTKADVAGPVIGDVLRGRWVGRG